MAFDIDGARKAGYSDTEIANHLSEGRGFDTGAARNAGYSDTEIVDYLSNVKVKPTTWEKVKDVAGNVADNLVSAVTPEPKPEAPAITSQPTGALSAVKPTAPAQKPPESSRSMLADNLLQDAQTPQPDMGTLRTKGFAAASAKLRTQQDAKANAPLREPARKMLDERTAGDVATDYSASLNKGIGQTVEMAGTIYGLVTGDMDNAARNTGERYVKRSEAKLSPFRQQEVADQRQKLKTIEEEAGRSAAFFVALADSLVDPMKLVEQLPQLAIGGGAGKLAGGIVGKVSATAGTKAAVGTAVATNAAMEGADPAGDAYKRMLDVPDALWQQSSAYQAELASNGGDGDAAKKTIALSSARKLAGVAGGIALGASFLPGGRTIDNLLVGGAQGVGGRAGRAALGGLGEGAGEALQEGGGAAGANLAVQQIDPNQRVMEGVGAAAGEGAGVGGPMGAAAGFATGAQQDEGGPVPNEAGYRAAVQDAFRKAPPRNPVPQPETRIQQIKQEVEARKEALRSKIGIPAKAAPTLPAAEEINQDQLLSDLGGEDHGATGSTAAAVAPQGGASGSNIGAESLPAAVVQPAGNGVDTAATADTAGSGGDLAAGVAAGGANAVDAAAHEAATSPMDDYPEPTEAQKSAGVYKKGHVRIAGIELSIENPQGSIRRGIGPDGKAWETPLVAHYGYVKGTRASDGDHSDVFIKPGTPDDYNGPVFVVDQVNKDGSFDEHKAVIGAASEGEARALYLGNYEPGWTGLGAITQMPVAAYKSWVKDGVKRKPLGDISNQKAGASNAQKIISSQGDVQVSVQASNQKNFLPDASGANPRPKIDAAQISDSGNQKTLSIGTTPSNAEPVTVKNGAIHIGKYPAQHFETGEDITVPVGADAATIAQALRDAGAVGGRQKIFGVPKAAKPTTVQQIKKDVAVKKVKAALTSDEHGARARKAFIRAIKDDGGIAVAEANDISGEPAHIANRMAPGLFRKDGNALDLVARRLHELGYLSDADYNDVDGGVQAVRDLVGQALAGEPVMTAADQERYNELVQQEQRQAEALSAPDEVVAEMIDAETSDDDLPDFGIGSSDTAADMRSMGFTEAEITEALNSEKAKNENQHDTQSQHSEAPEATASRAGEADHRPGQDKNADAGFSLESQSPAEVKARDDAVKQQADAKAKAEADAEAKQKADAERDNFSLAGSSRAADANPNQADIFSQGNEKPATLPKQEGKESQASTQREPASKPNKLDTAASKIDAELDSALAELAAALKKQSGQVNSGIDPAILALGVKVGSLYVAKGMVKFAQYSRAIVDALKAHGVDAGQIKPLLKQFYAATKQTVDDATFEQMDDDRAVRGFDLDSLDAPAEPAKHANATAPEHVETGVDDRELGEIVDEFNSAQKSMVEDGERVTHVFDAPAKSEIVRLADKAKVYKEGHGWMTVSEARAHIAEWKAHAAKQGEDRNNGNAQRVVLSLFDLTGKWSQPWEEAGYQVYRFDIQDDPEMGDVNNFSTEFFNDWFGDFDGMDIYAVLAATPCTDFASSGARHFAAKDADGRTVSSVKLVHQTLNVIEYFKPAVWAVENPVGRIERLGGLPPWRLSFDPNHLGDPYTKKTILWGRFNGDLPVAPVEPTEGSKMHSQYGGKSMATKNARSATPEGFSYGFFMANNAVDNPVMAIANKHDRLDRSVIQKAVDAGVTEAQISEAVDDFYYMDLDDAAANEAIRELMPQGSKNPAEDSRAVQQRWDAAHARSYKLNDPAVTQAREAFENGDTEIEDYEAALDKAENASAPIEKIVGDKLETNLPEVEHVTGKGKTLSGVVTKTLTKDQVSAIDKFTFKKDGGYFIRMKHVVRPDVSGTHTAYGETSAPETRVGAIASEVKNAVGVAPGTRFNGDAERKAADRLDALLEQFEAGRATPLSPADKLRGQADALTKEAQKMVGGIEPGQPVRSTADRNKRDKAMEKMSKSADLLRQADEIEAGAEAATIGKTGENNVTYQRSGTDLERDSQDASAQDGMGEKDIRAGRAADGGTGKPGVQDPEGAGGDGSSLGLFGHEAAPAGKRGDFSLHTGSTRVSPGSAGSGVDSRGGDAGIEGTPIEPEAAGIIEELAESGLSKDVAKVKQRLADAKAHKPGLDNIRETLPILHDGQQEDVHKAETRFATPDGYGMLFTNGTGTGKTFSGLGIVKRFDTAGKNNILIVAPNDKIIEDWQKSGELLGLKIGALDNTNDAGRGIVITTYANMGQNDALASRDWDLVVHDEAHYLAMDKEGTNTNALKTLRAISLHPDGAYQRAEMQNRDLVDEMRRLALEQKNSNANNDMQDEEYHAIRKREAEIEKELKEARAKFDAAREAVKQDVAARQGEARPRTLFLSATPFAYEKTVDWANGYLFDYNEGRGSEGNEYRGYNAGSNRDQFMMQHFGYRMRYGKLTQPDAKVDTGLMQRQFNGMLKKSGALSGRMLDVKADYDRRFVLVDSAIGTRIDEALQWFDDKRKARAAATAPVNNPNNLANYKSDPQSEALSALRDIINEKFDYLSRRYLLEAIKAHEVIPHVREHMALGRKVVVFHDYKKGGGFNPFNVAPQLAPETDEGGVRTAALNAVIREFRNEFRDLIESDVWNASSPIAAFIKEFQGVLLFNGDVSKGQRRANVAKFQDDASGPQVILVQSAAGKEGISLHDTTGKHQRVLFNLGQPTQPTTAIQQEGRIYRTGQVTDAIFRYLNTGTIWEKIAFATTIATRASTAENLGMGEQARALKDAFIAGFEESSDYHAGMEGEGKGGKERDRAANEAITEYDRARAFYYGTAKKTGKTKAQEGTDYFATPEPVGLKMMQWANLRPGEAVLEPSAGHGAIARWAPDNAEKTAIEPSYALRPRLAMVFDGKILDSDFEDLNIINKYDAVVMNPPFGSGGKTAIEHVAKAAQHLRDGGRIVALIPQGASTDKRFEKWFYGEEQRTLKPVFEHPTLGAIYRGDTLTTRAAWLPSGKLVRRDKDGTFWFKTDTGETSVAPQSWTAVDPTGARSETYRPAANLYLVADINLPTATFERAGTQVSTHIVVIEKQNDKDLAAGIQQRNLDYSDVSDINDLFEQLEDVGMNPRSKPDEDAPEQQQASNPVAAPAKPAKVTVDPVAAQAAASEIGLNIIEHTTGKGKVIRGVVRTDLGKDEAKAIDEYTFKKDGGWFIREKHLGKSNGGDIGAVMFSRNKDTRSAYENRIDDLFSGKPANRVGALVLDRSDVLDMLGMGNKPVLVAEHKAIASGKNHGLTAEHWKKIPEWLDNPAAVFDSDTVPGRLLFVAPEKVNENPVVMIVEPDAKVENLSIHLLVNAYDKTGGRMPVRRWVDDGLLRYIDKAKSRQLLAPSGLQLSGVMQKAIGSKRKIYTDSDLVKYRSEAEPLFARGSNSVEIKTDVPSEYWLKEQIDYAKSRPRTKYGVPYMGKITASFNGKPTVPVEMLASVNGERGEQDNVRWEDLDWLKQELLANGLENVGAPYIEIGYDGVPWVSEGNHRIMAAQQLGWKEMPVEVRYFDGGERKAGKFAPDALIVGTGTKHEAVYTDPKASPEEIASVRALNRELSNYFGNDKHGMVLFEGRRAAVPRALTEAFRGAFGRRIVFVQPRPGTTSVFNGFQVNGSGDLYVNGASNVGFVQIAGHELWHSIQRSRPDLIDWYRQQSRQYYKNLPAYRDRLNQFLEPGEQAYTDSTAESELEADFLGDSLADPEFLQQLANDNPTRFKQFVNTVRLWLADVAMRLRGLGSKEYVTDVRALQQHLGKVLKAFADDKPIADMEGPQFSRSGNNGLGSKVWRLLAGDEAIFQNPLPDSFDMEGAAKEIDPGMSAMADKPDLDEQKTGIVKKWYVKMPDGTHAYVLENKQGEVWLDASRLEEGASGGTKLYLMVGSYAEGNGKVFIGDPAGLSDVALIRRTENMLSLALRFGKTDFMRPHEYQMNPDAKYDTVLANVVRPLGWVDGDDAGNIDELLRTSYANTIKLAPEIKDVTYNFDKQRFEQGGAEFTEEGFKRLVAGLPGALRQRGLSKIITTRNPGGTGRAAGDFAPIGSATLKRTAVLNTVARAARSGRGGELLAEIGRVVPGGLKGTPLAGILYSRSQPPNTPNQPQQTPPPGGVSASVPSETRARKAQRIVQDQFNRFTVIQDWLHDNGVKLTGRHDVYRAEERMHGKIAAQVEDFRTLRLQPLIVQIHKTGFNMRQIGEYLVANHAAERNAQIATINPGAVDAKGDPNGSGMSDAEAQTVLARYGSLANASEFKRLAESFRAITDDTKQTLLDAGIISKDMADAWSAAYQNYVPLRGGPSDPTQGQATGKGMSVNARSEKRRAMGHQARDEWVVENIIHAHERAIYLAEKNRVGQYLLSLAAAVPDSRLWTIDKPVKRKVIRPGQASYAVDYQGSRVSAFDTRKEADLFVTAMVTSGNKTPSDFMVSKTIGDPQVAYMASGSLADNEVQIYVKGNMVRIQLNDPLLARAYKKMGQAHLVGILELGRTINTFLSKAYTGLNPEFIVSNVQRDLISGVINVTGEEGAGIAAKTLKNWLPSLRDMLKYSMTGKASSWVQAYREDGGNTGAAYLGDLDRINRDVQTAYEEAVGVRRLFAENKTGKAVNVAFKKSVHLVTAWIEHLNAAAENGMRVALYRSMVEAGKGRAAAASAAKNSTVNFNRRGEIGAELSALYLFANPSIQGAASMGHALFKGKHKAQAWALMGTLAGLAYLFAAGYGDDDEWDEVPQHEKDRNMLIRVGDKVVKIAVPYGHGLAFALGNAIYDLQRGKDVAEQAYHMASSIFENLVPVNPLGDKPDMQYAVTELMPFEPARVFARVANNVTGFQSQIRPESKFDENQPDFLKVNRNTHGSVYDQLTRGMNMATGGTATQAGAIDVSPETLKFLWESATGGTGKFFIDAYQASVLAAHGSLPELQETPILRKFARDANRASDARARFWDSVNKADAVLDDYHRADKGTDYAAAPKFTGMQIEGLSKRVDLYKTVSGEARDAKSQIKAMDGKTPAEKRLMIFEIERRERELYRRMVKDIDTRIGEKP